MAAERTPTIVAACGRRHVRARGFSLLEVLVTMIICSVALLGALSLQSRAQRAEFESYQQAQALVLLRDMVERLQSNRPLANCLAFTTQSTGAPYVGTSGASSLSGGLPCSSALAGFAAAQASLDQWDAALKGAAERAGGAISCDTAGSCIGSMAGARGCVSAAPDPSGSGMTVFTIAVAWQGDVSLFAVTDPDGGTPRAAIACGSGLYGPDDTWRRVVWTTVRFANLRS